MQQLSIPITDKEIETAPFSIGSLKALGEDGIHVLFNKKC